MVNDPNATAVADDEQPDPLGANGKPKPVTAAPGTLPNVDPAPLPGVATASGLTPGSVPPISGSPAPTGPTLTPPSARATPSLPAVGAATPAPDLNAPYQVGSGLNANNPNATPGNPFSGMTSAEGGKFGPAAGTSLNAGGILSILGGQPGQYDQLAGQLASDPNLYHQWQGILNNDPASVAAAINSGNPQLAAIAKDYAQRNASDSSIAFGPQGQTWSSIVNGTYQPHGTSPFLSQAALPTEGSSPATGATAAPAGSTTTEGTNLTGGLPLTPTSGTGSAPLPAPTGPSLPATGTVPGTVPTASGMGNVAQTATTPTNALTNDTLSRAPGQDRFKLAQDAVNTWNTATAPQFESDLRDASRQAAGRGQIGSGMLRTHLGDITANRDIQRNAAQQNYLTNALNNTIADQFGDVGIAQQQQGFQAGQQGMAFNQALQQAQGEDALTNSAFQRALQEAIFGSSGNPADTQLALAKLYGSQATGAGNAAGAQGKASSAATTTNPFLAYLQSLGIGGQQPDYSYNGLGFGGNG